MLRALSTLLNSQLLAYKDKYGDTLVAKRFVDDPKLGTWVETQRVQYKKCLAHSREVAVEQGIIAPGTPEDTLIPGQDYIIIPSKRLNAERLGRLNEIGFAWSARPGRASSRKSSIGICGTSGPASAALAVAGASNDEHAIAPASPSMTAAAVTVDAVGIDSAHVDAADNHYHQQGPAPLAQNSPQHMHHNHHQQASSPSNENINQNSFGWDDMYARLVAYKERVGNCLVPKSYPDDVQLAQWVEQQRMHYKAGVNVNDDRKKGGAAPAATEDLLQESIEPVHVDPVALMDEAGLQGVAHEADVRDMDTDGETDAVTAGHTSMRGDEEHSAISAERLAKLDAIGFVWNVRGKKLDDHWDNMLNQVRCCKNGNRVHCTLIIRLPYP